MTVTKNHLTNSIHNSLGLGKRHASRGVESLLETIKKTPASGENILISGFGEIFSIGEKPEKRQESSDRRSLGPQCEEDCHFQRFFGPQRKNECET